MNTHRPLSRRPTRLLGTFLLGAVALGMLGCNGEDALEGNGVARSETRSVEQFVRIENKSSYDVRVAPGAAFGLTVNIDENLLPMVRTSVIDGTLLLESSEPIDPEVDGPSVTVTLPILESVRVSGSGDVDIVSFAHPAPVRLEVTGSGDLDFHGSAPLVIANATGSGDIELAGSADRMELDASGSGDIESDDLTAKEASVRASGAGDVSAHVNERVDVTAKGSGNVRIRGGAQVGALVHDGSGDVSIR